METATARQNRNDDKREYRILGIGTGGKIL